MVDDNTEQRLKSFPSTRYMGSKQKLLPEIEALVSQVDFSSALDLFSGTGAVGFLFKAMGKRVTCNDYMYMSEVFAKALIENSNVRMSDEQAEDLLVLHSRGDNFVQRTFGNLYYSDEDNRQIDIIRENLVSLEDGMLKSIGYAALIRACMKKRPRGIFTYTGARYLDGRPDLTLSVREHFLREVRMLNKAVFDNGTECEAVRGDALQCDRRADLVYMDPPYYSPYSDNEYVRRCHFVEGLARNWKGVSIQENTKTKKFKSYPTPFSRRDSAAEAFSELFDKHASSVILVSYSSNSLPTKDEMVSLLRNVGKEVEVVPVAYRYSFGNKARSSTSRNEVKEYLFLAV